MLCLSVFELSSCWVPLTVAFQSQHYEFKQRKNRLFVFENQYTGTASALICALKSRM